MPRKNIYLSLAVVGTVAPYGFFFEFVSSEGLNLGAVVSALFVNGAAGGFTAGLLITSIVFWVWSYHGARQLETSNWWLIPIINLMMGLSAALPFYLYLRHGKALQTPTGVSH